MGRRRTAFSPGEQNAYNAARACVRMRRCVALAVLVVVLSGCSGLGGDGSNVPDGETAASPGSTTRLGTR